MRILPRGVVQPARLKGRVMSDNKPASVSWFLRQVIHATERLRSATVSLDAKRTPAEYRRFDDARCDLRNAVLDESTGYVRDGLLAFSAQAHHAVKTASPERLVAGPPRLGSLKSTEQVPGLWPSMWCLPERLARVVEIAATEISLSQLKRAPVVGSSLAKKAVELHLLASDLVVMCDALERAGYELKKPKPSRSVSGQLRARQSVAGIASSGGGEFIAEAIPSNNYLANPKKKKVSRTQKRKKARIDAVIKLLREGEDKDCILEKINQRFSRMKPLLNQNYLRQIKLRLKNAT